MKNTYMLKVKKYDGEFVEFAFPSKSKPRVGSTVEFKDGTYGDIVESKRMRIKISKKQKTNKSPSNNADNKQA